MKLKKLLSPPRLLEKLFAPERAPDPEPVDNGLVTMNYRKLTPSGPPIRGQGGDNDDLATRLERGLIRYTPEQEADMQRDQWESTHPVGRWWQENIADPFHKFYDKHVPHKVQVLINDGTLPGTGGGTGFGEGEGMPIEGPGGEFGPAPEEGLPIDAPAPDEGGVGETPDATKSPIAQSVRVPKSLEEIDESLSDFDYLKKPQEANGRDDYNWEVHWTRTDPDNYDPEIDISDPDASPQYSSGLRVDATEGYQGQEAEIESTTLNVEATARGGKDYPAAWEVMFRDWQQGATELDKTINARQVELFEDDYDPDLENYIPNKVRRNDIRNTTTLEELAAYQQKANPQDDPFTIERPDYANRENWTPEEQAGADFWANTIDVPGGTNGSNTQAFIGAINDEYGVEYGIDSVTIETTEDGKINMDFNIKNFGEEDEDD